ncbi:MAG: radical SAM protein, partial [Proteobacteria bacterium]|nr:radical SAM protein [Pseudomonadota bacterium]
MRNLMDRIGYVPKTCVWEITRACNLNCQHCGSAAGPKRHDELTTDECLGLVKDLAELGCQFITLSGGEPTVRSDWPQIARAATDAGMAVNMVTNGMSNPHRLAQKATESGLTNIGVSIDGMHQTHDSIRAPGAFVRAVETVRVLAQTIWVDIMFTVNQKNLFEMEAVYLLAKELGARGFRVQLGKPMGNQTFEEEFSLEPKHLLTLMPLLGKLARSRGPFVNVGDSIGYFSPEERLLRGHTSSMGHWTGCYAGCRGIGIQSDGGIKGCLSLQPREGEPDIFVEGNIRDSSLREIWFRPGAFAYNRCHTQSNLKGACARCDYGEMCRGGASCVAHTYTG